MLDLKRTTFLTNFVMLMCFRCIGNQLQDEVEDEMEVALLAKLLGGRVTGVLLSCGIVSVQLNFRGWRFSRGIYYADLK